MTIYMTQRFIQAQYCMPSFFKVREKIISEKKKIYVMLKESSE